MPTAHPQLSQAQAGSRVVTVPQVTSSSTDSTPSTGSSVKANVAWEGVKTALVLLKESSGWFPPLKSAIGGFLALVDATELASNNSADLEFLRQKIDCLTAIIEENSRDCNFPWLLRRLSDFAEKLNEILKNIDKKSNHGKTRRFAEGKKDKGDITVFTRAILDLISNLQSELILYTTRGIKELLSNESLKKLKESEVGCYDALISGKVVQRRSCTPNTRQKILEDLMEWAKNPHKSRLYWMNGMAGTGKTTIAYSLCEQLQEKGLLGANFFCSRSLAECSDVRNIIPTTARQLARSSPQFASALLEVLGADIQPPSLGNQLKRLIWEPFQRISEPVTDTLIVVIDALDECTNGSSEIRLFLEQICNYFSTNAIPLKLFVTSRPEGIISSTITPTSPSKWSVFHIHDIEGSLVQADIKVYIEDEFTRIAKIRRLENGWPPSTEVDVVVGNANRLFIYAATVIRYVGEDCGNPRRRLSELASASQGTSQSSNLSTQLIDELYRAILKRALGEKNPEEKLLAQMVVKLVVCAQTPFTLAGIADLLNASEGLKIEILVSDVRTALELLPSVISTPMDEDGVATTFHVSFPDFLFDERRCGSDNHIPFRQSHQDLARLCLHFMDKSLTIDNITGSDRWQTIDAIVKQKKIGSCISSALAYTCMFWASHIETNDEIESLSTELGHFLTHGVLRWLEVLSLLRRLDIGVEVLRRMKECKHPTLASAFDDAYKFLKDVFDIINVLPCEVFYSGLMWAPKQSFIRKIYLKTLPFHIVCGHRSGWGACEPTIRGHSGWVSSVAISPDNCHIVSGSSDKTVRIWNMSTGEEEHVLRGHSGAVWSVTVYPDYRHIVSGSKDKTVRIWNASTGEEEHVLLGHSSTVNSVNVSSDSRCVVSGSWDRTIRFWNASTGEQERVLRGHSDFVCSVAFSPDNCHVVSGSLDQTVRVWNASTGEEEHVLRGHSAPVRSVAVSSDNLHIVSGSPDRSFRIWNTLTGEEEHVLQGHVVNSIALSSDRHHIVSGSPDKTVRIWNMLTGEEEHVLRGHSDEVFSVAFSHDNRHVVSGSLDKTVRISNVTNVTTDEEEVHRWHSQKVCSVAVSSDNRYIVSGSWDKTVRIWDASTGEREHILWGHSDKVNLVNVSPDNHHVVSGSMDKTIRIWNALTGNQERVLRVHSQLWSVAFSPDNRHIVSGSEDNTVRVWNVSTGEEEHVLRAHFSSVNSVVVASDNLHIVSGSFDRTVRIWNMLTGKEEHVLRGHSDSVCSVAISPDNRHIVSGSWDNTVRIWNVSTSDEGLPLVISFVISSGNCQVISGPQGNSILIGGIFLSSMVTSIAHLVQGDNVASIPVIRQLVSGERLDLGVLIGAIGSGLSPVPIMLTPDASSVLLSNGEKCLTIPSSLRDITCAAFSGSKIYLGYGTGRITILDISV